MLFLNSYWASRLRGVKEKKWHLDSKIHFFCVVPLSLRAKNEFWYSETGLFATCTSPIMHLKLPPPPTPPPQILHNLCFLFPLGITALPREIESHADAKFWGANKVGDVQVADQHTCCVKNKIILDGTCLVGIHCRHTHTIQDNSFLRDKFYT